MATVRKRKLPSGAVVWQATYNDQRAPGVAAISVGSQTLTPILCKSGTTFREGCTSPTRSRLPLPKPVSSG